MSRIGKPDVKMQASGAMTKLFGAAPGEQAVGGLRLLAHDQILVETQTRRSFRQDELEELAASIDALRDQRSGIEGTGILQALLVTPLREPVDGRRYQLVAGERRYRASQMLQLPHVPVIVLPTPKDGNLAIQIVENLQRADLTPLDEAAAIQRLMDERLLSIRDAAAMLGKSKSYLTDRLALLKMGEDVRELLSERSDTLLHARVLDKVQNPALRAQLIEAVRHGASFRDVQRRAAEDGKPPRKSKRDPNAPDPRPNVQVIRAEVKQMVEQTQRLRPRVVELQANPEKGLQKVREELRLWIKRLEAMEGLLDGVHEPKG